jgi:hypothetical protein
MFNSTDYKVLCRDCNTVYPLKQISPTRDFSNFQHVALLFSQEHCSTTMKFALIAPALLSLAVAGPLPSSEGVHVLTKRQTRPIGSCEPGPNFCGFSLEECNTARGSSCPLYKQVHSARSSRACGMPCSSQPRLLLLRGWSWRNWGIDRV